MLWRLLGRVQGCQLSSRFLTEFFGKEPRRTMNASECVSKGCALECAILSPTFKVKEFPGPRKLPFFNCIDMASMLMSANCRHQQRSVTYTIGPFQATKGERAKVKVKARLNLHGIVSVESARWLIEEDEVDVPVTKEATKMDTDKAPADVASGNETDVNMQDANVAENGATETGDVPVQMETDTKVEAPKKKVKKSNIPVSEVVYGAMLPADVQKAVEKEFEMALQDRVMEETKDKKNAVEAYVYDMRNKLHDKLQEFVTDSDREALIGKLQETEDWLYEDGEDETKGVYVAKLDELKKQGDPIEQRYKEHSERGSAVEQLLGVINAYRQAAASGDSKYEHIDLNEKQKVLNDCSEAENWLREKTQQQESLPKHADPVLLSSDIRRKAEALDRGCRPIMSKPKPAPPKAASPPEAPPSPAPAPAQEGEPQATTSPDPNTNVDSNGNPDEAAAMETEKPE
ncbi:unnamed protein product [Lactuca virosa]|uniref:Uncharacterized protein n=1 Tax=Lactuca virosa TaxID=75947 RepID=A0AAU9MY31_9ASTR|nr:unnamed protein product [Lactuca virosa]